MISLFMEEQTSNNNRQEYTEKPLTKDAVRGLSSQTIFKFMTLPLGTTLKPFKRRHPLDMDDFERNRALLLWYPEWKARLPEMATLSVAWAQLTAHWTRIEQLYEQDEKACRELIRSLVRQ